ncbi:MAG: DUF1330 domain-containing protein [Tsuneonella sp.]
MTAWLFITATVHDRAAFMARYAPAAAELVTQFGGRYLIRARGVHTLEGSNADGASVVVSEWPDRAAAKRFWDSREYREVSKLREGIADVTVLLASDD